MSMAELHRCTRVTDKKRRCFLEVGEAWNMEVVWFGLKGWNCWFISERYLYIYICLYIHIFLSVSDIVDSCFMILFIRVVVFKTALDTWVVFGSPIKGDGLKCRCNTYGVYAVDQVLHGLVEWCYKLSKEISEKLGKIDMKWNVAHDASMGRTVYLPTKKP